MKSAQELADIYDQAIRDAGDDIPEQGVREMLSALALLGIFRELEKLNDNLVIASPVAA